MKKTSTHKITTAFQKAIFISTMILLGISTADSQTLGISCNVNPNAICPGDQVIFTAGFDQEHAPICPVGSTSFPPQYTYVWKVNETSVTGVGNVYAPTNLAEGTVISCTLGYTLICFNNGIPTVIPYSYYSVNTITTHFVPTYPNLSSVTPFQSGLPQAGSRVTYSIPPPNPNLPNVNYTWSYLDGSSNPIATYVSSVTSSSEISITLDLFNTPNVTGNIIVSATPNGCIASTAKETSGSRGITIFNDPPPAPTNVRVTGSADANSISLSWIPSNTPKTVTYQVYSQDQSTLDPYMLVPPSHVDIITSPTLITANVHGLTEPNTYKFYVTCTDTYNAVSANSIMTDPYTIDHTAPDAPTISGIAIEQTDNSVTFMWSTPMDNVLTTGYNVYLFNGPAAPIATVTNNMYTASFITIPVGYFVKAFDLKGNESLPSNQFNVTQKVDPFTIDTVTGFVGIGVNPPSDKLDVDGNLKVRGDIILEKPVQSDHNVITFTGSFLDIYTPVQGVQYGGGQPIISISQWGEMKFNNSSPYLNANTLYFLGTTNYNNGMRYSNNFGTTTGFSGPVIFGDNGGALGSSTLNAQWDAAGDNVALNWDNKQNVTVNGALSTNGVLSTKGGLQLQDGSILSSTQSFLRNGQSNVSFSDKLQIIGTDPYLRIGSLVMQDLSSFTSTTGVTSPGGGAETTTNYFTTPDAFVFGNMYFDAATQTYKSIFDIQDSAIVVDQVYGTGSVITNTYLNNSNGGTAINFNSVAGNIEFVAIPSVAGQFVNHQWSIDKSQINSFKRMVIANNGSVGIGLNPNPIYKLDVKGNERVLGNISVTGSIQFKDGSSMNSAQSALWVKSSSTSMYANTGVKVGIGNTTPAYPLDILGTTGQDALHIGRGNLNVTENVNISGTTKVADLFVTGVVHSKDVRICLAASSGGACPAPPDYVFQKGYKLRSLEEVEEYVNNYQHLPEVPSAKELEDDGMGVTEMNFALLRKVEELTLYTIELKKELRALKKSINIKK